MVPRVSSRDAWHSICMSGTYTALPAFTHIDPPVHIPAIGSCRRIGMYLVCWCFVRKGSHQGSDPDSIKDFFFFCCWPANISIIYRLLVLEATLGTDIWGMADAAIQIGEWTLSRGIPFKMGRKEMGAQQVGMVLGARLLRDGSISL